MTDPTLPDPWPEGIKRSWEFTITFKGLDGSTVTKTYIAHEKERASENFMRGLMEQCITHRGGWEINHMIVKRNFNFEEMPPAGSKVIEFRRLGNDS